ncbi:hypothetical protein LAZ67_6002862 [Cordylochernes scorpioides]|uniref:Uncharacterized protein n=1 Tax=Cordylochernes scorpioides TaxID=51811 RepID=A0ABY6KKR6_9ARAC|nr:hypothetical protein LAZ67_6002862 [Cordylochernes scorpioides]
MLESAAKASASMLGTASNYRQSQTFTKVCLDHGAMINESCTPTPHSMRSDVDLHAALWERPLLIIKQLEEHELMEFLASVSAMSSFEQRANIKFCVKLKKSFTETLALINEAYEDEKLS